MYSNGEDLKWFNYTFMTYKDSSYGTDGYLRVSGSTSTPNYQNFNTLKLQIAISNNHQKTCTLGLAEVMDLIDGFDKVLASFKNGFSDSAIKRKVGKALEIIFVFFIDEHTKELLVKVEMYSNETDFTRVIMPLKFQFKAFSQILRQYLNNYFSTGIQIIGSSLNSQHIEQIPTLLKSLPSGIVSQIPVHEEEVSEDVVKGAAETAVTIDDLGSFLTDDELDKVEVPELEKAVDHEQVIEIKSTYVKSLNNDLSNLETFLTNITLSPSPVNMFADEVGKIGDMDFKPLPGLEGDAEKSLLYMSKLYFSISHLNYMNHRVPLPHATPVFKYKAKDYSDENLELAYDLLIISLYVRTIRRRLEGKDSDAMTNCSLFHIQLRCFVDPFIFSFLDSIDSSKLHTICIQRYKYFDSIGFFETYKKRLTDVGCPEITEEDISASVMELSEKVIGKAPYITELHEKSISQNSLRLTTKNNFSLEQIINEIIPLELEEKMGKDIKDEEVLNELNAKHPITDEILNFFKQGDKKVKVSKTKKVSNIERIIKHFDSEIPDEHKEALIGFSKELINKKFDFVSTSFPLDDLGENIIKSLYLWDPEDKDIANNYKHFFMKVEEDPMGRELILAKVKTDAFSKESDDGWGEVMTNGD